MRLYRDLAEDYGVEPLEHACAVVDAQRQGEPRDPEARYQGVAAYLKSHYVQRSHDHD